MRCWVRSEGDWVNGEQVLEVARALTGKLLWFKNSINGLFISRAWVDLIISVLQAL